MQRLPGNQVSADDQGRDDVSLKTNLKVGRKHRSPRNVCRKEDETATEISAWETNLERARGGKDVFFAEHRQSPIPPQDRLWFKGLEYYPPDPSYRFELELHEHPEKQVVRMAYTKGNVQDFICWGEFRFNIGGKEQVVQAYKRAPREEMLFIPFKDATSGKETYGAGRYIDLEPDRDRTPERKWILDFNCAYNPWCVYSEDYTCPFVPTENWLQVPIHAGEKNYPLKAVDSKENHAK